MAETKPFTRADLPQFTVTSVEGGEPGADGFIEWRLRGQLNQLEGVTLDGWSFLLLPGKESLTGDFGQPQGPHHETSFCALTKTDQNRPEAEGLSLACLGPYHRPHHVLMVEDGPEAWVERVFAASDAVAEKFVGTDGQAYRKLSMAGSAAGPGDDPSAKSEAMAWIVPGGWDHEHCEICNVHIDPEDRYFHHAEWRAFLCVSCYEKYVVLGNIEFALPG
ncbi:MAG TPA: hypothetical protein VHX60_10335 [Acidobacteriaceae bacterium]|nr:hypothetical protein [Acidobacteriaceae bacterium]